MIGIGIKPEHIAEDDLIDLVQLLRVMTNDQLSIVGREAQGGLIRKMNIVKEVQEVRQHLWRENIHRATPSKLIHKFSELFLPFLTFSTSSNPFLALETLSH